MLLDVPYARFIFVKRRAKLPAQAADDMHHRTPGLTLGRRDASPGGAGVKWNALAETEMDACCARTVEHLEQELPVAAYLPQPARYAMMRRDAAQSVTKPL